MGFKGVRLWFAGKILFKENIYTDLKIDTTPLFQNVAAYVTQQISTFLTAMNSVITNQTLLTR